MAAPSPNFALAGAAAALALDAAWWIINARRLLSLPAERAFQQATVMLWPSSTMMVGDFPDWEIILAESAVANAVLYAVIGATVWYGMAKHRAALLVPIALIALLWWRVLTL